MSYMKRFAEQVAEEMGHDGLDEEVLAEGQRRLDAWMARPVRFKRRLEEEMQVHDDAQYGVD